MDHKTYVAEAQQLRISAIIPTLNRCNELCRALESLRAQTLPPHQYEIIVVDNGSEDATADIVEGLNREGGKAIQYIREERRGLHWARHAGAIAAHGQVVAFTDDDAIVDAGWLRALSDVYDDPQVGAAGGRVFVKWEGCPLTWIYFHASVLGHLDRGPVVRQLRYPEAINGANFSIRRDLLFRVGGFNPDNAPADPVVGDGEVGLCRKVYEEGKKIIYVPEAIVWHVVVADRVTLAYMKRRFANNGVSAAYADYQSRRSGCLRLLTLAARCGLWAMAHKCLAWGHRALADEAYYRHELTAVRCWSQALVNLRLLYDPSFRRFVKKEDWISDF